MSSGEFELISRYFAPLTSKGKPAYGLTDDAAVYSPPENMDLVFTKDALVAGVHFNPDDPVCLVARKAMRVNLSDLAAMGAKPVGYLLALALPKDMPDIDQWVSEFTSGLKADQAAFQWELFGGDTVSTSGPLMISLTAIGIVERGCALRRHGARAGDNIFVSGTLGDSALGLKCLQGEILPSNIKLVERYQVPIPRLELGQMLKGMASSVMDISDGLAGDIRHIAGLSRLGAAMKADLIPLSQEAGKVLESFPAYKDLIWNGGDDYELLFTAPDHAVEDIRKLSEILSLPLTCIGRMTEDASIVILDKDGNNLLMNDQGFRHF